MAEGKDDKWSMLGDVAKSFGLGGVLAIGGLAIVGLSIFKGPDFAETWAQFAVLIGGSGFGLAALLLAVILLRGGSPAGGRLDLGRRRIDVFIAAPMAGFGSDAAGRKAAVDIVQSVQAALQRLGLANVHAPTLARPDASNYESPATAFDVELAALRDAKRYLLILPATMPPATSVLMTVGMAIALKIPCVVMADKSLTLPFLLEGAALSKAVNLRVDRYQDAKDLEKLISNDGLKLFGGDER